MAPLGGCTPAAPWRNAEVVLRFATGGLPRERRQSPLPRDPCRPSRRAPSFRDAERERPARIREMPANAAAANPAVLCPMGRRPRGGRRPDPPNNADRVHGGARISASPNRPRCSSPRLSKTSSPAVSSPSSRGRARPQRRPRPLARLQRPLRGSRWGGASLHQTISTAKRCLPVDIHDRPHFD